jgi:hypothetical protein
MGLKTGRASLDWIRLAKDKNQNLSFVNTIRIFGFYKTRFRFFKETFTPCSYVGGFVFQA